MSRVPVAITFKGLVICLGAIAVLFGATTLRASVMSWGFLLIFTFGIFVSPRMSLTLPRSRFAINFSDALILLTLLLYGTGAAIILAVIESLVSCLYLRSKGIRLELLMVPTNISISAISTAATATVSAYVGQTYFLAADISQTHNLVILLGGLALTQFLVSTSIAAVIRAHNDNVSIWQTWKRDCFGSSMTQIVGAGLAGLIYKLINYGDVATSLIAFAALAIAYLNYKRSIDEINKGISKVEEAERQKAVTERARRREAERHAGELSVSLEKEERANVALRKSEQDFQHAALHDSLTGLANRKYLGDILRRMIVDYAENSETPFQVLFLDIRSFKNINDSLGHPIGDKVLMIAAKRFVRLVNDGDVVARIGGDEFAIILKNLSTSGKAQKVARKLYDSLAQPFSISGTKISIDVNIGIAPCDAEYRAPEEILRDADIAMHYAKENNRGLAVFTRELRTHFLEKVRIEMDLARAVEREELSLHYQPIVKLNDGRLIGFEALLRWHHGDIGMIPPIKFIPVAESSGLIRPITVWILSDACRQLQQWRTISHEYQNLIVSVNISGKHLSGDNLIGDVEDALRESALPAKNLKLEITESSAMENAQHTISVLNRLKALGVQLSIDDFGTGYSSLSYLQRLPFDTLKIDRSFISAIGAHGEHSEIVQTIVSLAKNLKMRVIAEGIETPSQLGVLSNLGCDFGQGFL
ncbi:MAG: bifunctional diguanylate cyclase/phosphodiesterase, partial [Acidobacteria bacterium]|nr:bifunctional diguanylate cyclase/phosphodiesterase [Acidobacteriota bacterium]MCA1608587.1 bifunctional diguanylate cyclase/phosphodiesterase [Acidobacteriota bacterium]